MSAVYLEMNRPDLAELQWRQVVCEMPQYRAAWRGLAESQITLGRYQTAQLEISHMLESESLRSTALLARAKLAASLGRLAAAKQDILTALQDYPAEIEPLEMHCRYLFEHGEPSEARLALRELAERLPSDGAVQHNLGTINARLGYYEAAVAAYEESLRLRPESEHTQRELAEVLRRQAERSGELEHAHPKG